MNNSTYKIVESTLYDYACENITAKECKSLLSKVGVTINLTTCWILNKAELNYKGMSYTVEV